jgi:hypothetical protein
MAAKTNDDETHLDRFKIARFLQMKPESCEGRLSLPIVSGKNLLISTFQEGCDMPDPQIRKMA